MAKEGWGVIVTIILFTIVITIGAWITEKLALIIPSVILWIIVGFSFYFFRDPARTIPAGANLIVSPADGKIICIQKEYEPLFLKQQATKVSIFLSIIDVHVNRIPIDGKVTYFDYSRGSFHPAFKDKASSNNEQTIIGIESETCGIIFKQIAGILARRIVCNIRAGNSVKKGERFGMIKFGSRVDMFLPKQVQIHIKLNEHVKGGETIIGLIHEK